MKTIYLGGGCFWCTEAVFKSIAGVHDVIPGYMGGHVPNPSYESVCSGITGHAETIKIVYDEHHVQLADLLDIFFASHDPTTLNRQGNDIGSQYRSVIFYTDDYQRADAEAAIARAQKTITDGRTVVTEVGSATEFYPAEDYHQNYYTLHQNAPYCQIVISPKLEKLQKEFKEKLA